jgi:dolichol-phosphate mannosyltransferase
MAKKQLLLSIIIPCYNEESVLETTYKRIKEVLIKNNYRNHEIIFINDGSVDKTLSMLEKYAGKDKNVKVISFSRNFGHQAAVSAGIQNCNGEIAIIIDADLQDPPELFSEMIELYKKKNCNIVYGVRKERKGETIFKKLTAKLYYRLLNFFSDAKLPVDAGDFRLIDKKVIDAFKLFKENNKYIRGMISWMGFKQMPLYYIRDSRFAGKTKYSIKKMLKLSGVGMFYFSKKPLKLALNLGFLSIFVGLCLAVYTIVGKFKGFNVPGWSSLLITIIFFGGIQLFTIGILGEYIGNIFEEVKSRPEFIIDKKINFKSSKKK